MTDIQYSEGNVTKTLGVRKTAGSLGAVISGVDLASDLSAEAVGAIRRALLANKVIFFRRQHGFDDTWQERLAEKLGGPVAHPTVPVAAGSRYLLEIDAREGEAASSWHTDVTFIPDFPAISILRGIILPEWGGHTLWANTALAYETLPTPLKVLADSLHAIHTNQYDYSEKHSNLHSSGIQEGLRHYEKVFTSTVFQAEHPVVHIHPETGQRALLLGHFVQKFVGLSRSISERVLEILQQHLTKPELTVRWEWQPGDVAIWDNRATQHRAIADFGNQRRHLRRATIRGEAGLGVDGFVSRSIPPEEEKSATKAA